MTARVEPPAETGHDPEPVPHWHVERLAVTMIRHELASPKATRRSVGVLYAVCIQVFHPSWSGIWTGLNADIKAKFGAKGMEAIKRAAWDLVAPTGGRDVDSAAARKERVVEPPFAFKMGRGTYD